MAQATKPTLSSTKPQAPKASAKPGTPDAAAKKHPKRVTYSPIPEGGLTSIPTDYDSKVHLPLKRTNFKNEADFYDLMAARYETAAKKMRQQAEVVRKTGGRKELVKVNRLKKMQEKMVELRAQLAAQGLDLAELGISGNDGDGTIAAE